MKHSLMLYIINNLLIVEVADFVENNFLQLFN